MMIFFYLRSKNSFFSRSIFKLRSGKLRNSTSGSFFFSETFVSRWVHEVEYLQFAIPRRRRIWPAPRIRFWGVRFHFGGVYLYGHRHRSVKSGQTGFSLTRSRFFSLSLSLHLPSTTIMFVEGGWRGRATKF